MANVLLRKLHKNYRSIPLLGEYLNYLTVIKGLSRGSSIEYRTDILMFKYQ